MFRTCRLLILGTALVGRFAPLVSVLTVAKSPNLLGLSTTLSVQIWSDTDPSRNNNIRAPEIHFIDGQWHLHYSAAPAGVAAATPSAPMSWRAPAPDPRPSPVV